MKTNLCQTIASTATLAIALLSLMPPTHAQEKAASQIPPEEKPFWDSAQAFVDAYAQRDAAALGKLFTEDAEFYDEFGERTEGRTALVAPTVFAAQ